MGPGVDDIGTNRESGTGTGASPVASTLAITVTGDGEGDSGGNAHAVGWGTGSASDVGSGWSLGSGSGPGFGSAGWKRRGMSKATVKAPRHARHATPRHATPRHCPPLRVSATANLLRSTRSAFYLARSHVYTQALAVKRTHRLPPAVDSPVRLATRCAWARMIHETEEAVARSDLADALRSTAHGGGEVSGRRRGDSGQ